jgi:hypothetical protein
MQFLKLHDPTSAALRQSGPSGGVADSLDEAKAAFRAQGLKPSRAKWGPASHFPGPISLPGSQPGSQHPITALARRAGSGAGQRKDHRLGLCYFADSVPWHGRGK